jgi:hypothetical protein
VQANSLSPSMFNPILIYSFLAVYGVLTLMLLFYVHTRFRTAARVLTTLKTEWNSAETRHSGFLGKAQDHILRLTIPAPVAAPPVKHAQVNFDMRNQVVVMGKKGFNPIEIAKACGLQEGEVDVLLSMARLQSRNAG